MSSKPLLSHLAELQTSLKNFSLLADSKHETIMSQLESLKENSQKSYTCKINYLSLSNQVRSNSKSSKTILFDKDISEIYSYSVLSQIKEMLKAFKNDSYSLRLIIRDVIVNWRKQDQTELAECLVNCFLWQHDLTFPYAPLAERLYDIIDVDMQILSEKGRLDSFLSGSFSMKIFDQISKLPESQNYIKQTMSRIYETMDLDYIEGINLEEAAFQWKNYLERKTTSDESRSKESEDTATQLNPSNSITSDSPSDFYEPLSPVRNRDALIEELKEPNLIHHRSEPMSTMTTTKKRRSNFEMALAGWGKILSNIEDLNSPNRAFKMQTEDTRSFSISELQFETKAEKDKRIKEMYQKLEMSKFLVKTILEAVFVTPKYIPTIIRIFLKIVCQLYEKYSRINAAFYFKTIENNAESEKEFKLKIKSELHRLLVDILATKWLVPALFIYPDKAGLIINRPINKLRDILLKFSKIFVFSLRGKSKSKSVSEENFIVMFESFIKQHYRKSKSFLRSVLNIWIEEIIPKSLTTEKFDEFEISNLSREYSKDELIDVYWITEGLIHKIFYSYLSQIGNIKNTKLENAIKTLGKI